MKKLLFGVLIGSVLLEWLAVADATAQTSAAPFTIQLVLEDQNGLVRSSFVVGKPIMVRLTVSNATGTEVIVSAGFTQTRFHLMLRFFRSDGVVIVAPPETVGAEGPPPLIVEGEQAEPIEFVVADFQDSRLFDARTYYDLSTPAFYRVKAELQVTQYKQEEGDLVGTGFARIGSGDVFTIMSVELPFSINADLDGDTFFAPEGVPAGAAADCNDGNPDVKPVPGTEVPGNGLDDDCDPATSDVVVIPPGNIVVTVRNLSKKGVSGLDVRAFPQEQGACSRQFAEDSPRFLKSVWNSCQTTHIQTTDAAGQATFVLPVVPPGSKYLVVTEYTDSKGMLAYDGDTVVDLDSNETLKTTLTARIK